MLTVSRVVITTTIINELPSSFSDSHSASMIFLNSVTTIPHTTRWKAYCSRLFDGIYNALFYQGVTPWFYLLGYALPIWDDILKQYPNLMYLCPKLRHAPYAQRRASVMLTLS